MYLYKMYKIFVIELYSFSIILLDKRKYFLILQFILILINYFINIICIYHTVLIPNIDNNY
jgi:hypothetical protein